MHLHFRPFVLFVLHESYEALYVIVVRDMVLKSGFA